MIGDIGFDTGKDAGCEAGKDFDFDSITDEDLND